MPKSEEEWSERLRRAGVSETIKDTRVEPRDEGEAALKKEEKVGVF